MAFAIFYNLDDLAGLQSGLTRQDIQPTADRQLAQSFWNAGLNGYASAPLAPDAYRCVNTPSGQVCDPNCRIVVVNGRHQGQDLTLAQLRALLYRQAGPLNVPILTALADDMAGIQGAKDPWP